MIYLAVGAGLVWLLMWSRGKVLTRPEWRVTSGVLSAVALAAAAFFMLDGWQWGKTIVLTVLGLYLSAAARLPRPSRPKPQPEPERMSVSEAYAMLDLEPGCTREDVQAAYTRLMKVVHPDKGGGAGLASRLNAARDRLLKG